MGDDVARRQARWVGVLNVVRNAERTTVEALLRLAHGSRAAPAPAALEGIREAFKKADEGFEMSGNSRELQVLAGASLAVLMEDLDEENGSVAALAVTTASLGGFRAPDLPMNLAALGEAAIERRGEVNRKRPSLRNHVSIEAPKVDFEKAAAKVQELSNFEGVAEAFRLAAEGARIATKTLAQRQVRAIRAIDDFIRLQDEELQMLWWLTGQRSEDYDCAFEAVPSDVRGLVFANELAKNTAVFPGPPSIRAILSRAGLKERKKIRVTAAVNTAHSDWLRRVVGESEPSPVSMPLHFAIKRQLETGPGDAWVAGWAASTGVDPDCSLPGLSLGELFYRERLLALFELGAFLKRGGGSLRAGAACRMVRST